MLTENKKFHDFLNWIFKYWFWVCLGTILLCFFIIPLVLTQFSWGVGFGEKSAHIGDTVGGIVTPVIALIGVVLTFIAFYIQYEANQLQNRNFKVQQFESAFFAMINLHRNNVDGIDIDGKYKGRAAFTVYKDELHDIYDYVSRYAPVTMHERDKINIAYLIFLYGMNDDSRTIIQNLFVGDVHEDTVDEILTGLGLVIDRLNEWRLLEPVNDTIFSNYGFGRIGKLFDFYRTDFLPASGHQEHLGHYFRQLIRTVKFVEQTNFLTDAERKRYIQILRAQLSTYELALFFFSSLSDLGYEAWYLEQYPNPTEQDSNHTSNLTNKYQLTKNLPSGMFTFGIEPIAYFPEVHYVLDYISAHRAAWVRTV